MEHETTEAHESFVTVSLSRISGLRRFFGSSVESSAWVELRVYPAELKHYLGADHIRAKTRPIIEVALSPAQFAELLTSMNVGSGVPGTMQSFNYKAVPELPLMESETGRVRAGFEARMRREGVKVKEDLSALRKLFAEKKVISQADRKSALDILEKIVTEFCSNMPFHLDQFEEAAERIAVQAKAEVDSFITHAVMSTGLEVLRAQAPKLGIKDKADI